MLQNTVSDQAGIVSIKHWNFGDRLRLGNKNSLILEMDLFTGKAFGFARESV